MQEILVIVASQSLLQVRPRLFGDVGPDSCTNLIPYFLEVSNLSVKVTKCFFFVFLKQPNKLSTPNCLLDRPLMYIYSCHQSPGEVRRYLVWKKSLKMDNCTGVQYDCSSYIHQKISCIDHAVQMQNICPSWDCKIIILNDYHDHPLFLIIIVVTLSITVEGIFFNILNLTIFFFFSRSPTARDTILPD